MIDKIVMHIPVDMSLVDIREDGKYCIFGMDLFDIGIRIEAVLVTRMRMATSSIVF
jgi:hypothetical protein